MLWLQSHRLRLHPEIGRRDEEMPRQFYTIILTKAEVQPSPCTGSGQPSLHLWSNARNPCESR